MLIFPEQFQLHAKLTSSSLLTPPGSWAALPIPESLPDSAAPPKLQPPALSTAGVSLLPWQPSPRLPASSRATLWKVGGGSVRAQVSPSCAHLSPWQCLTPVSLLKREQSWPMPREGLFLRLQRQLRCPEISAQSAQAPLPRNPRRWEGGCESSCRLRSWPWPGHPLSTSHSSSPRPA